LHFKPKTINDDWWLNLYFNPRNGKKPLVVKEDETIVHGPELVKHRFHFDSIQNSFLSFDPRPHFVYNGTHVIKNLHVITNNKAYKKILQTQESAFYFNEPLTHYIPINGMLENDYPHILRIDNESYEIAKVRCLELESLNKWVKEHNLKKLTVYCPDYNSFKHYSKIYTNLSFGNHDFFVSTLAKNIKLTRMFQKRVSAEVTDDAKLIKEIRESSYNPDNIKKKFFSAAWRYDPARHFITAYLAGKGMIANNNVSFYFKMSNEEMKRRFWFGWKEFIVKHPEISQVLLLGNSRLQHMLPLSIEATNPVSLDGNAMDPGVDSTGNFIKSHCPDQSYIESFCVIINESRVAQPWPNISEKTLNAIKNFRPFVMVGAPGTIEYLHKLGFKTFNDFWSEDYDKIVSNKDRLVAICELISEIDLNSLDKMKEMYNNMLPILLHNEENLNRLDEKFLKLNRNI
jgi:hypothetical protein